MKKNILIICTSVIFLGLITAIVLLGLSMHKMKAEIGKLSRKETIPVTKVDATDGNMNPFLSGKIGNNLTWEIDLETFVLTIEGKGDMDDSYSYYGAIRPTYYHLYKDKVQEIDVGDEVTSIAPYAFQDFTSCREIWIGDGVSSIGESAFDGCENLQNVVFTKRSNLQTIGAYAFSLCGNIDELKLPDNYINFEADLKNGGRLGLENIPVAFDENNREYVCENSCVYSRDKTKLIYCPLSSDYPDYIDFAIPDTVTVISTEAFDSNSFNSLTIPGSIKTVEDCALSNVRAKNLVFEEGVQKVNNTEISNVDKITLADSVVLIHEDTFPKYGRGEIIFTENSKALIRGKDNCIYTKDGRVLLWASRDIWQNPVVTVPEGVERIAPEVITDLGYHDEQGGDIIGCELSLPDSLKSIGDDNFKWSTFRYGYTVKLPKNLFEIGTNCFVGCNVYSITIPKSITKIGDGFLKDTNYIVNYDYDHPIKTTVIIEDKTAWEKIEYKDLSNDFEINYSKSKKTESLF